MRPAFYSPATAGLTALFLLCAPCAHAQTPFTITDDASTTKIVSLLNTPNAKHNAYTGFYQRTGTYQGKDPTMFQVYGYSAANPIAYSQYDAEKANIGGPGAKFTSVVLSAVITPADHTPTSAVTLSASADGTTYTPLQVKVKGPIADGGYSQIYTFSAANFKPARYIRFGVKQDPTVRDKAGKFYPAAGIGSVVLHGIKHAS